MSNSKNFHKSLYIHNYANSKRKTKKTPKKIKYVKLKTLNTENSNLNQKKTTPESMQKLKYKLMLKIMKFNNQRPFQSKHNNLTAIKMQ